MNDYLLTLILKPGMEEKKRKDLLDSISKKITGSDGKIEKQDLWGVRDLAYAIKRQTKGYFVHFEIQTDPKEAKGIDKTLKTEEDILRYLLIRR
jgi:small subunit ribosomal protein S6